MNQEYEMTYKEIGKELGLSRQTIAHIERTAFNKIRNQFNNLGDTHDRESIESLRESKRKES